MRGEDKTVRKSKKRRRRQLRVRTAARKAKRPPANARPAKKRNVRVKTVEDRLFWKIVGVGLLVAGDGESGPVGEDGITDEEYHRAYDIVVEANRASASMLQQRMGIGYNHASRIMHLFEKRGVIGPPRGAGPREVLVGK